jgi:hypothetical protein
LLSARPQNFDLVETDLADDFQLQSFFCRNGAARQEEIGSHGGTDKFGQKMGAAHACGPTKRVALTVSGKTDYHLGNWQVHYM